MTFYQRRLGLTVIGLLLSTGLIISPLSARDSKIVFDHITIKNGLSDGRIDCITQDSFGFLWFGTQDGLNRFDGYNFTVFDHDIFDSTSISSNWIRCITEDKQGNLWIGTEGGGLNQFNFKTEQFTRWVNEAGNPKSLNDNFVRAIIEDSYGILWIGTRTGLVQFDREKEIFSPFHYEPFNESSPAFNENVTELLEASDRNLWVGTQDGIYLYDRINQAIEHLTFSSDADRIATIFEDSYGDVWIGSRYNGIRIFDRKSQTFIQCQNQADDMTSLSSNEIKDIFEDYDKNLWIATIQGGLNLFDRKTGKFRHYNYDPNDPSSLSSNSVRSIYQDRTGVIWIGMDGSGIDRFVKNRQKFQLYNNRLGNPFDLSNNTILSIYEDAEGILWLGTEGGGLNRFDRRRDRCIHYINDKDKPFSISSDQVTCLLEDSKGVLWVGTKEGLNKFDKQHQSFERFYNKDTPITSNNFINVIFENRDPNLILGTNNGIVKFNRGTAEFSYINYDDSGILSDEVVLTLLEDRSGLLWIGYLRSGLVVYNSKTEEYVHYRSDPEITNSLSTNFVQYIYQDQHGNIWVATRKGLNKFDPVSGGFRKYTKTEGLPSNVIVGILEDQDGNLWLSTSNGLSKFNPVQETFTNYNIDDGLQGNQFWIKSCYKSSSEELFFGGNNGFNSFYPERLAELSNPHIPPIVITNVTVLEKPYLRSVYAKVSGYDTLRLAYNENRISFEFAALDFTSPAKNQFAYMLEGFDDNWINAGTRRYANYTNLNPGNYIFRVKGANNDGVWNEAGTLLSIHISTPFWKTGWAYLLYIVSAIGLFYGINVYLLSLVRARHDLKIERMEKEKVQEINRFKLQFFTDVAHEFKTPLTLIQAPLEEILNTVKKGIPFEDEFRLMHRNVKYLLRLVHQLLSFRRVEQKRIGLKVSRGDLAQFAREIFGLFKEIARKHLIDYQFNSSPELIEGWIDWGKMEEILVNLIDNAFKYTPDGGKISVNLEYKSAAQNEDSSVSICISDTGTGISKENLTHIFERFYIARNGHYSKQVSSGLGLALTKRLVELHHGNIEVESDVDKGSRITVSLPLGKDHLRADEIISDISETVHYQQLMESPVEDYFFEKPRAEQLTEKLGNDESATILIVEDNDELRAYMHKSLVRKYNVTEARDGQEGLEKARKLMPNIVISDVIMPNIDGIEMCRILKNDINTSHIPIILLTAKSTIESKIEGIETGADDYIEKPFHFRFLDARIKNILSSREKLRERYRQELIMEPEEVTAYSTDEIFLTKIRNVVENRLADPDLEVRHLSSEAGLSRTNLFIKLKALTGYSPNEFIKTIRLEKAAQFLRKTDMNVSEIAYQVGFKYPKYFSTCYSQRFGITPSEFRQQNRPSA